MAKTDYTNWTRDDLIKEIVTLRKRKKYGIVWENTIENVVEQCKRELPVLEEVVKREVITDKCQPTNLIIEGDNYHALSVLNYTHQGKIDFIYIDPPYNTGARDWKYNNDYVDSEDSFRHSKWVSFMHKRIQLAKKLLKPEGLICVTIDNYEVHNLIHILKDVFPDKEIVTTVILHNFRGRAKNNFALCHEYAVWVLPLGIDSITHKEELAKDANLNLRRTGQNSLRKDRPTMFYGIEVNKTNLEIIGVTKPIKDSEKLIFSSNKDIVTIYPIDKSNIERRWYYGAEKVLNESKTKNVFAKNSKGKIEIYFKFEGKPIRRKSVWFGPQYDSSANGTVLLTNIIGQNDFTFPKSLYAVKECIEAATANKNALILDFFAGSGTTGHAVLELNKYDGGNRTFILCTNNENKIAEQICYPRIKKVIEGYTGEGVKKSDGLGGNLKYYKTNFVPAVRTDKNKVELTRKATEMICIKEETFDKVEEKNAYKIYKNRDKYTGIIFDYLAIDEFKKKISRFDKHCHVYIFSLGDDRFNDEFEDIQSHVSISPIPEAILRVYRKIFK